MSGAASPVLWDIRDRAPVVVPQEKPGAVGDPITDADLDEYERAYARMPGNLRARYDRCMATIDVVWRMALRTRQRQTIMRAR